MGGVSREMLARLSHGEPLQVWATLPWLGAVAVSLGCHRTCAILTCQE
jgi:hypothetical protein